MFRSGWHSIDQFDLNEIGLYLLSLDKGGHVHVGTECILFEDNAVARGLVLYL